MRSPLPPWLGKINDLGDTAAYAAMTPDQRLECFVDVCELARVIIADRPDRRAVLDAVDPLPPEAEQTWLRLVREGRRV